MKFYSTSFAEKNHSILPQFVAHGNALYAHPGNETVGSRILPWYEMRGKKIYATAANPKGHTAMPMYEMRGNKVYTTLHNPEHRVTPVFQIRK